MLANIIIEAILIQKGKLVAFVKEALCIDKELPYT